MQDVHRSVQPHANCHLAARPGQRLSTAVQLVEAILIANDIVLGDAARLLEAEDVAQILTDLQWNMEILCRHRLVGELFVELLYKAAAENQVCYQDRFAKELRLRGAKTIAEASAVSCSLMIARVIPVASSTKFIRQ
jgi:hypothetical protein